MSVVASTTAAEVLLALKIAFLVLLYLFVWRVIRAAGSERRVRHDDSMILSPSAASAAGLGRAAPRSERRRASRLVVQRSPTLDAGSEIALDSAPLTVGRGGSNDIVLDGDDFASSQHARIESRGDGVWVQDLESTNGTFVNGERVLGARRMAKGDVLRVGETDLILEEV